MKWLAHWLQDDPGEAPKMREMSSGERDWMIIQIAKNTAETARALRSIRNIVAVLVGAIVAVIAGNTNFVQIFSLFR